MFAFFVSLMPVFGLFAFKVAAHHALDFLPIPSNVSMVTFLTLAIAIDVAMLFVLKH